MESHGDEGRDKLRKATGRSTYPVIRGWPNGVTRLTRVSQYGMNKIVPCSNTQGTEPSKYLEEQTSKEIS